MIEQIFQWPNYMTSYVQKLRLVYLFHFSVHFCIC